MSKTKNHKRTYPVRLAIIILCISTPIVLLKSCQEHKTVPYEHRFAAEYIKAKSIHPVIESITIDTTMDNRDVSSFYERMLKRRLLDQANEYKRQYDYYQRKYDLALRTDGKYVADRTYLVKLMDYKAKLDSAELGSFTDDNAMAGIKEYISNPPTLEQITVKYRESEQGPLIIETYRAHIQGADTMLFKMKGSLAEYMR
jgi:hypothetical protein